MYLVQIAAMSCRAGCCHDQQTGEGCFVIAFCAVHLAIPYCALCEPFTPELLLSRTRGSGLKEGEPLTSRLVDSLVGEAERDGEPLS